MQISNDTPFSTFAFNSLDSDDSPVGVVACRGTFDVLGNSLAVAHEQPAIVLADIYRDEPLTSSVRIDTDLVPRKLATDITFNSVAYAPRNVAAAGWDVSVRVGRVSKNLRVTGPRSWKRGLLGWSLTAPESVLSVPIQYELAFGGTAEVADETRPFEPNPVGLGFVPSAVRDLPASIPAPQIEAPDEPITRFRQEYQPAGLGPIAKHWTPRRHLCGTADDAWKEERWPMRPVDFDFRYYNSAPEGLVYPGFLTGDEDVLLIGLSPDGPIEFRLPGIAMTIFGLKQNNDILLDSMVLDTLHIDTEAMQISLTWRLTVPGHLDFSMIQLVPERLSPEPHDAQQRDQVYV